MPLFGEEKRKYQREWYAARRIRGIEYLGGMCYVCGSGEDLEVDHKDPTTKFGHRMWSWSWKRILEELDKCQLLCDSCHKDKTRRNGDVLNGVPDDVYQKVLILLPEGQLSQREIARELGMAQSTVSRINTGARKQ